MAEPAQIPARVATIWVTGIACHHFFTTMSIRVLIFDDHPVAHYGLTHLLTQNGFEVVGHAYDGSGPVEKITQVEPDVILLDVRMPKQDGLKALEEIHRAGLAVKTVMYSEHANPTYVARAIALGAFNYVLKSSPLSMLMSAIRDAAKGIPPAPDSLFQTTRKLMRQRNVNLSAPHSLTGRELQVLRHLALGLSNREIGSSLGISVETVKEHVQTILRKQNSSDRTQAAVWGIKHGIA